MSAPVDPSAADFFSKQLEDPENIICCDCGIEGATWASISHGIYLSIGAAGLHRSLGVKVSFVQSTSMDSWKPIHLRMMELGGNQRFNAFLAEQGIPVDMPIREKYSTCAAKWYRDNLRAVAEGLEPLAPLPIGTGHLPALASTSSQQHVLDKVFAEPPHKDSMSLGGIHDTSSEVSDKATSRSLCEKLAACFKSVAPRSTRCAQEFEEMDLLDSAKALPTLLSSTQCPTARRLQTLSYGKMEGFGSTDSPLKLVAVSAA